MWKEIILFELHYRKARPATYIYFLICLLFSFLLTATPLVEGLTGGGQVHQNGSYPLINLTTIVQLFVGVFISSAVMGVAIIRDFENKTESIFFTTNITKFDYLIGRFVGSFIVLNIILLGIPLGFMLSDLMPWRDAFRMGPFNLQNYLNPYFLMVLPNAFMLSIIFFSVGALSRKMIVVFMQGLIFIIVYLTTEKMFSNIDNKHLFSLLDFFGMNAVMEQTEYWSIYQKNFEHLSLSGDFLLNRILWLAISLVLGLIAYRLFSLKTVLNPISKSSFKNIPQVKERFAKLPIPYCIKNYDDLFSKAFSYSKIYFRETTRSIPFIGLSLVGIILFIFACFDHGGFYQTKEIPLTYIVLQKMTFLVGICPLIMAVLFAGELVWKERENKLDLILDASPIPTWLMMTSKLLALLGAFAILFGISIIIGIIYQLFNPLVNIDFTLYLKSMFGESFLKLTIYILAFMTIQVLVNNKFLGYALSILLMLLGDILDLLKVKSVLWAFGSGNLGTYSEMNQYGHFVPPFLTLQTYWLSLSIILFILASLCAVRGTEQNLMTRIQNGKHALTPKLKGVLILFGLTFIAAGVYYYYNTQVLNKLISEKEKLQLQADFERSLKRYENVACPKIVDVNIKIDLYPKTRTFDATGYYWIKNKTDKPMPQLHVFLQDKLNAHLETKITIASALKSVDKQYADKFGYYIYTLQKPLLPNDSIKVAFEEKYLTKGFEQGEGSIEIVNNGTFFSNSFFPSFGYNMNYEMADDNKRIEYKLPKRERMLARNNTLGHSFNDLGKDADFYTFQATLSTDLNQIAIAPGYLQKKWTSNNRRYFDYKMDAPMDNMYSIVSAAFAVKKEKYKGINLEIYYETKHTYNIARMLQAMKNALDYYQSAYGPYQFRQLRIMEFPRYREYAQSFVNTIPFSEQMGFITDVDDKKDVDVPTFVTAHEIAHQWWGHQICGANVQGAAMLSESFSEYSALMVMKKQVSDEQVQKFIKNELNRYLIGRSGEQKKELPLSLVENQQYIHYSKGSMVLYGIQDYIGEKALNGVMQRFLVKSKAKIMASKATYPTTKEFTDELLKVLPDSLKYLSNDWFDKITLYELKTDKVLTKKSKKGYEVSLTIDAAKIFANDQGKETNTTFKEWMWIGVYDKDKLMYYKRHKIHQGLQNIRVYVNQMPTKAGIDPKHILIDRHLDDNLRNVE